MCGRPKHSYRVSGMQRRAAAQPGCIEPLQAPNAAACECRLLPCLCKRKQCCANGAFQGGVQRCDAEQYAAACECRLLPCKQPTADAGCCRGSESMAAQTEPFKAECSACRDERVQLRANAGCCRASNRLRMQAVAVIEIAKALLRKRSPSRRSAALSGRAVCS